MEQVGVGSCINHTAAIPTSFVSVSAKVTAVQDDGWVKFYITCTPANATDGTTKNDLGLTGYQRVGAVGWMKKSIHEPTDLSVQKVWDDMDNILGDRPKSIDVVLQYKNVNNSTYSNWKTVTLNEGNGWYYHFTESNTPGLVRKDNNGTYDWTIKEVTPKNYKSNISWTGNLRKMHHQKVKTSKLMKV